MAAQGSNKVTIVGAGLAGTEAALQLASHGVAVRLIEQKPLERTPAQTTDHLCELVCSNSFRGADLTNAVGLLKEEMRRLGSFVMRVADRTRVPAGGALAVDRELFARGMTELIDGEPLIERVAEVVRRIPDERPLILATGPLTGEALAEAIAACVGRDALAYYDAIAPIVSADSIEWDQVFLASRWDRGSDAEDRAAYVNCPMNRTEYEAFVGAICGAQKVEPKAFEKARYFEGCLPIEVMAERGVRTLAFGPMKPVGLTDPRTGRWPYAVVQLRKEDEAGTAYNLVGFQTRMTWPEQRRVLRTIPGLRNAEFQRYGAVHRNTFINAPKVLDATLQALAEPGLYFAGQVTGVEGYVESAACGWLSAHFVLEASRGAESEPLPATTAHGGLLRHLSRPNENYQPSNITFSHLAPFEATALKKRAKYQAMAERALADLAAWQNRRALPELHIRSRAMASANIQ